MSNLLRQHPATWLLTAGSFLFILQPAHSQFTTELNIPPDPDIGINQWIYSDTQLNLGDGGAIGSLFKAGSPSSQGTNIEVNISGGSVGDGFRSYTGSSVNISGGSIGYSFGAHSGSTVNISGGDVGISFDANSGSIVNISGGTVGYGFDAYTGSTVNITGGTMGFDFDTSIDSTLNLFGGEFRLDGTLISGLEMEGNTLGFNLPFGSVLSGTLTDGTPFAFGKSDMITDGTLTLIAAPLPAIGPALIVVPTDPTPQGIRAGQTLMVAEGGFVGDYFNAGRDSTTVLAGGHVGNYFEATDAHISIIDGSIGESFDAYNSEINISGGSIGVKFSPSNSEVNISGGSVNVFFGAFSSMVNISGGSVGNAFYVYSSNVNISGGTIGNLFRAYSGSEVNITAGSVGTDFTAKSGSTVNISGGSVGSFFNANDGSTVNITDGSVGNYFHAFGGIINISGGSVGDSFEADSGSTVNFSGGAIGNDFDASSGSEVNLFGTQFLLDGSDITASLTMNIPFTITDRDATLSGFLADGSPFDFDLNSTDDDADFFDPDALLTITLTAPGDFNGDLAVNGTDFLRWQRGFGSTYDSNDLADWEANFSTVSPAVAGVTAATPEPSTGILLVLGVVTMFAGRWTAVENIFCV